MIVASSGGPVSSFFFKVYTKQGPAYIFTWSYIGKNKNKFLSETTWHRALLFAMQHHLVDLYHGCSNYAPVAKLSSTTGVICFTHVIIPSCYHNCSKYIGLMLCAFHAVMNVNFEKQRTLPASHLRVANHNFYLHHGPRYFNLSYKLSCLF